MKHNANDLFIFSCNRWGFGKFEDIFDMPLDFPYSRKEWDSIFTTLIKCLNHQERWIRLGAIFRLQLALELESTQVSNCEEYQPENLQKRMRTIFTAVKPIVVEDFCNKFKSWAKEEPYKTAFNIWLNRLIDDKNSNFYNLLSEDNGFKMAVARIDGYLKGLSSLCHSLNYVPICHAVTYPKISDNLHQDIQSEMLARYSQSRFSRKELREICDFGKLKLIENWENSLEVTLETWIFNRLLGDNFNINNEQNKSANARIKHDLIRLIEKAFKDSNLEVYKFPTGGGYDYICFGNERYAFSSKNKLFVMTFGWVD